MSWFWSWVANAQNSFRRILWSLHPICRSFSTTSRSCFARFAVQMDRHFSGLQFSLLIMQIILLLHLEPEKWNLLLRSGRKQSWNSNCSDYIKITIKDFTTSLVNDWCSIRTFSCQSSLHASYGSYSHISLQEDPRNWRSWNLISSAGYPVYIQPILKSMAFNTRVLILPFQLLTNYVMNWFLSNLKFSEFIYQPHDKIECHRNYTVCKNFFKPKHMG